MHYDLEVVSTLMTQSQFMDLQLQPAIWRHRATEERMGVEKMTAQQVEAGLGDLSGWELKNTKLHRELRFKNFVQAWGFMTQVAILAERANHHPEWSNVYSRVVIDLTTHEAGGISQLDFDLAGQINAILAGMGVS
jgi:4a-hydroxytetrahydrobiopterin dehydratase